jgi:hypothetical protein
MQVTLGRWFEFECSLVGRSLFIRVGRAALFFARNSSSCIEWLTPSGATQWAYPDWSKAPYA